MDLDNELMTLTQMKEILMESIEANGEAIGGLIMSVDENHTAIMNLGEEVMENMDAIGDL